MIFVLSLLLLIVSLAVFTAVETRRIEARFPPIGSRVAIAGGVISVLDRPATAGNRAAVLLVHGASGNSADLAVALADRLAAAGFRVLSVDRPGHGWSDRIGGDDGASPAVQAAALRAAAEKLGVGRALVVVHSLGALAGLALALDHPDFVRALVLISPVSHPWPGGVAWYYGLGARRWLGAPFRRLVALPAGRLQMRAAVEGVFAPNRPPRDFIVATRLPLVLRPRHFRANCQDVAHAEAAVAAMSPRYGAIRAPTEIVTGDSDGVVYAHIHSAGLARDIAGARLTTLAGVGHSPHHTAPDRIVAIVLAAERRAAARETAGGERRMASSE
ncbi:pimeloyl-ACP methyl ester carboxylesterase [Roseiarcus fermentans]|uniref:Pimeloyl-ACP methyl ester carboxylesterase n=1 Tax=Roseiarcus fermentans TaxID=1473586 RepID=A0A366FWY0_9HYPH|nr:alpha/beta hydrolase [Roseiarcus fermentans]RBP18245.1 pimeloyl-ACP methyl ester carboxylesterase [Roseiarcus fermentans]